MCGVFYNKWTQKVCPVPSTQWMWREHVASEAYMLMEGGEAKRRLLWLLKRTRLRVRDVMLLGGSLDLLPLWWNEEEGGRQRNKKSERDRARMKDRERPSKEGRWRGQAGRETKRRQDAYLLIRKCKNCLPTTNLKHPSWWISQELPWGDSPWKILPSLTRAGAHSMGTTCRRLVCLGSAELPGLGLTCLRQLQAQLSSSHRVQSCQPPIPSNRQSFNPQTQGHFT